MKRDTGNPGTLVLLRLRAAVALAVLLAGCASPKWKNGSLSHDADPEGLEVAVELDPAAAKAKPKGASPQPASAPPAAAAPGAPKAVAAAGDEAESDGDEEDEDDEASPQPSVELDLENNARVQAWIDYFTKKDRERFQRFLQRGEQYRKIVQEMLLEQGLPSELYFLALIESGYQNHAVSSARAAGVWQFMRATGGRYGLVVNGQVDERRDPIRATEAAAKYLRDLYNIFGSWHLATAAYNAGEYRVIRAILKGRSRDFWSLADQGALPRETLDYVPKFIAAAIIGADPAKYGFKLEEGQDYPALEAVEIPSPIRLDELARVAGLDAAELKRVNPHLLGGMTPASTDRYELWVPKAYIAKVRDHEKELERSLVRTPVVKARALARSAATSVKSRDYHRVARGESLTSIARKYKTTVSYLREINNLRGSRITPGMRLRLTARDYHPQRAVRHRVRSGESLNSIARKYGTTVEKIKQDNQLKRSRIFRGQSLLIKR